MMQTRQARIDDPDRLFEDVCSDHGGIRRIRHRHVFIGDEGRIFITTQPGAGKVVAHGRELDVRIDGRTGNTFQLSARLTPPARKRLHAAGEDLTTADVAYIPDGSSDAETITIDLHYRSCRGKRAVRRRKGR
jgi:hypothetical protein